MAQSQNQNKQGLGHCASFMILIILFIALVLRLIAINQSLWLDEAINVNVVRALDAKSLILNYSLGDFHPPLFHLLLKGWMAVFGNSEIAVRLPSVIFGTATVFVTYLIGQKIFERKTALIAATLLATGPLAIYYSQEARMYALAALLTSLSAYFFLRILKNDTLLNWVGFIISTAIMLYVDYLPYLMMPIYTLYLLKNRKKIAKKTVKAFLPATILIFILIIPWLLFFPKQLSVGLSTAAASPAWAQVVGSPNIKSLALTYVKFTIGRISNNNNLLYAILFAPAGFYYAFLLTLSLLRASAPRSFLWYWLIGPIILAIPISFFVPIFAYFRFIFILPAFYLLLSCAITVINSQKIIRSLLVLALLINLVSSAIYYINPKFQREHWKDAVNYVFKNSTPYTLILFESAFTFAPFDYYNNGKLNGAGALDGFIAQESKVKNKLAILTRDKDKVFLFQYLSPITDPDGLVFRELTSLSFTNTNTRDFAGVGFVYEFKRQKTN